MRVSCNWLREYVGNLPEPNALGRLLTMSGTEVESVASLAPAISGVIIAEVLSVAKHPNADRLSLCDVNTGSETVSIVCGAKNMKPGDKVALARIGAELPGGFKIKASKIRGVESQGMMCSEVELGLKDASDGIMILPDDTPLGVDLKEALGLNDYMFELGVTPNRADLLSVRGVAREISALTKEPLKDKPLSLADTGEPVESLVSVSVLDTVACGRYAGRVITGLKVHASPEWLKGRLEAHGVRPINNIVDVTNYVLLEYGQPLHAFDLDKLSGKKIVVRRAVEHETIITIDGKTRTLDPSMLVIADGASPVALAGVMGGKGTEVSDATKNILLEAAWFDPATVRSASKKTGLSTDASIRFERGVDFNGVSHALDRATAMIAELAGGSVAKGMIDVAVHRKGPDVAPISFRVKRAEAILGLSLDEKECVAIFERLGMRVLSSGQGVITVVPPSWRMDILTEIDLVEEAARCGKSGYDDIPASPVSAGLKRGKHGRLTSIAARARGHLVGAGFFEAINYAFVPRRFADFPAHQAGAAAALLNPLSEDQAVMRTSLIPSLLNTLKYNLAHKNDDVRIFEFGAVFSRDAEKQPVKENWRLSGLLHGARSNNAWNSPKEDVDFYDIKGVVEGLLSGLMPEHQATFVPQEANQMFHPGRSAVVRLMGKGGDIGYLGQVHPAMATAFDLKRPSFVFELDVDAMLDAQREKPRYSAIARFPESTRDVAFIADEKIAYQEIIALIKEIDTKLIERVELFDVYYGKGIPVGKRSMAIRIVYRASGRTLTNDEVDAVHAKVVGVAVERFGVEMRGAGTKSA
ncbi:MAG: phenylalanine--tRNA ligase subunit beta [Deltaproteobacteria bacterium]|nr:phenylalanine--tRNA ligase subunit beta [Deltaproteobacteria bacterium]